MNVRTRVENMSIRHKLRAIVLVVGGVSVVGSCGVFLAYQWISSNHTLARQIEVMADVVADQSTAAMEFDQPRQAELILASLRAEREIVGAALYRSDGALFARYVRDGSDPNDLPARPAADGQSYEHGDLLVFRPLRSGDERIGTFCLRSDRAEVRERLQVDLGTVLLVLIGTLGASLYLTGRLEGLITAPVLRLAAVVQEVSRNRDYSIRAESRGRDEINRLIDGFNDMLSQIQKKDIALAHARDELETRVRERTRELESEVAERRAAQTLLQEKDVRLTEAHEIARLGSWEWNVATKRISWSDEVHRIYGVLPANFGGGFGDFVASAHPDDRTSLNEALETARRKREPMALGYRIMRPDGAIRFLETQAKVVLDDAGNPVRLVGTLQDVTERKLAEQSIQNLNRELQSRMGELAEVNKELEAFSYSVSHDLRAPLRAIDGFSQMLIDNYSNQVDDVGRRYLGTVVRNTRKMGQLIDDLLAFSRMSRMSLKSARVDMEGVIQDVFRELKETNADRAIELRMPPLPVAFGDPAMFRQVLVNLLSNAVKYTRGRDPALIEVGSRSDGNEVVYYIRDNGAGFEMQYADRLFGVFQRLHRVEEFEGTGVGLALVRRIVERHRGRVWAEGRVGEGATFYFAIPKAEGSHERVEANLACRG